MFLVQVIICKKKNNAGKICIYQRDILYIISKSSWDTLNIHNYFTFISALYIETLTRLLTIFFYKTHKIHCTLNKHFTQQLNFITHIGDIGNI